MSRLEPNPGPINELADRPAESNPEEVAVSSDVRMRKREEYTHRLVELARHGVITVQERWELEDLQAGLGLTDAEVSEIEVLYRHQFLENDVEYSLTLVSPGPTKPDVVALLQDELHLDRAEAIRVVNTPGGMIARHLGPTVARRLDGQLRSCGAEVTMAVDTAVLKAGRGVQFKFVWIPRGRFRMGDNQGLADEQPVHEVKISRGFWMMTTPVIQFQWERIMGVNPSAFRDPEHPVDTVSWLDCQAFIRRVSEISGGLSLRLPREEEWEYACRAGTSTPYYWGNIMDSDRCAHLGNSIRGTQPVGQYLPNPWGLSDMLGNVWEWCEDHYRDDAYSRPTAEIPVGEPAQPQPRVTRGGSWNCSAERCRSAARGAAAEYDGFFSIGFRMVMDRSGRDREFGKN